MQVTKNSFKNQHHLLKWLENQTAKEGRDNPITQDYSKSFTTVKSWAESLEYIRKGFNEGYEAIKKSYTTKVKEYEISQGFDYALSPCGFMPSIPHYLTGSPLNMWTFSEAEEYKQKVYSINIDTSVPWHVTQSEIVEAGAKLLTAANALEKRGHRVAIQGCQITLDNYTKPADINGFTVTIKESDSDIDLRRLSYVLTCPAFQRVTTFAHYDFTCKTNVYDKDGKGYSIGLCDKKTKEKVLNAFGIKGNFISYLDIIKKNMTVNDIIKVITE